MTDPGTEGDKCIRVDAVNGVESPAYGSLYEIGIQPTVTDKPNITPCFYLGLCPKAKPRS